MRGIALHPIWSVWMSRMQAMPLAWPLAAGLALGFFGPTLVSPALAQPELVRAAPARPVPTAAVTPLQHEIEDRVDSSLRPFYAARGYRPLWLNAAGGFDPAVGALVERIETAELDAIRTGKLKARGLHDVLRRARSGDLDDLARAEMKLSETFSRYVREMREVRHGAMLYESEALAPAVPTLSVALQAAAADSSLLRHVQTMAWMHPFYAPMRDALKDRRFGERQRALIWHNLDRIRALPAQAAEKYVLVDAVSSRLWMYEGGKPVDSMRVVVGKAETPTPMMAGFLRFAIINPYWNVPPDLVQKTIATNVLDKGQDYLRTGRYQVLSDWSDDPALIDAETVDWSEVAAGTRQVRVRQLPGGPNFMGKVKFEFPNPQGIYLHDTPARDLLRKTDRHLSNGCVRLEDAGRFGRWLLGRKLPLATKAAEQRIDLPQLVPVYITYLTAMPQNGKIAFLTDPYGRDDAPRMASATWSH